MTKIDRKVGTRKRSSLRSGYLLAVAALIATGAVGTAPRVAMADEGGVSFWVPGLFGSLAAAPQQPGWALVLINYYANVSAGGTIAAAREVTVAHRLAGGIPSPESCSVPGAASWSQTMTFSVSPPQDGGRPRDAAPQPSVTIGKYCGPGAISYKDA